MGQSYYQCARRDCGWIFSDYSDYARLCDCGEYFCSSECAEIKFDNEEKQEESTCLICRVEGVTTEQLLQFLLKNYQSEEEAVTKALEQRKLEQFYS